METPRKTPLSDLACRLGWTPLLALFPQGVVLTDDSGLCVEANPAAARILGVDRERLLGQPLDGILGGTVPDGVHRGLDWAGAEGVPLRLDLFAGPGPAGGRLMIFTDITEARAQERHLQRMTKLYAALSQVNQAIVWSPNREALLGKICEVMVEFGHFTMAWIGWNDAASGQVAVAKSYGDTTGYLEGLEVRSDDSPLGRGAVGSAIRSGRPCVVNDFLGSEELRPWHEAAARSGFAALAAFPIRQDGKVTGALVVYAPERGLFGPDEILLLEEAAGDISFALDHLELDARRREAEEALRDSRARLHRAESVAAFGNWELNLEDGSLRASKGARAIFGLQKHEVDRASVEGRVLPELRAAVEGAARDLAGLGRPYNIEFDILRASDGERRTIHSVAELDPERKTIFGVVNDITARKQAEDALKESEFFFKESQRAAAVGSYKADFLRGVWTSSGVLDTIFGIDETFVRSIQGWVDLIHPEDRPMMTDYLEKEVIAGHKPFSKAYRIIRKRDGETRWVQGLGEGTFDGRGVFLSLMGTIQDITDQKLAEQENHLLHAQLLQAQKMESLGMLAGGVAHDMNNVLGAVLALASAHLTVQPVDSPAHRAFGTIAEAATRGGNLVKSLLNFARKHPTEKRALDLNAVLLEQARLLEHTTLSKVRLDLDLAPDLRTVHGDAGALAHAMMNLCVNAVDAMEEGGTLALRTRNVGEDLAEIRVEDTGCGMSPEVLALALDPFFTTKDVGKGTGLGLSMVYSTVKAHHGKMDIESEPGRGTRITLLLPSTPGKEQGAGALPPVPAEAAGRVLEVLIVDDDDLVLASTRMLVEVLGHTVETAASGEEALARLEKGMHPDVVVLDMNMPGLGGKETLPRLRALRPAIPVLVATGRADQEARDLVAAHSGVALLAKPFTIQEVKAHLGEILRGR